MTLHGGSETESMVTCFGACFGLVWFVCVFGWSGQQSTNKAAGKKVQSSTPQSKLAAFVSSHVTRNKANSLLGWWDPAVRR